MRRGFKLRRLHKHFAAWFWRHGKHRTIIRCCPCSLVSHVLFVINQEKNHNLLVMNQKCSCRLLEQLKRAKLTAIQPVLGLRSNLKKKELKDPCPLPPCLEFKSISQGPLDVRLSYFSLQPISAGYNHSNCCQPSQSLEMGERAFGLNQVGTRLSLASTGLPILIQSLINLLIN